MRRRRSSSGFYGAGVGLFDFLGGACGDSLAEQPFTSYTGAGEAAFETQAGNHYEGTVDYYDAANSGTYLLESNALENSTNNTNIFWVDDSGALAAGPQFTNNIVNDANSANCYICSLGINDNPEIDVTGTTAANVEDAFDFMADYMVDTKGVRFMMLNTLNRDAGGDDSGCNVLREGTVNAIRNNPNIKRGVDSYDLVRADNKHLNQAGYEERCEREADQSGYYFGNSASQAIGPRISSAELKTDEITINLEHVEGTDITAPSSGNGGVDATDDGTAMGATGLTRVDANTAKLTFPTDKAPVVGSTVKLYVPYGRDGGLAATPDVMKDNSTRTLPIQSDVVTCTNSDPIQALDNVVFYFDARGSVKTITTTDVEAIAKIAGVAASASEIDAGDHGVWDSAEFGGMGAVELQSNTQLLYTGSAASEVHTFGIVLETPDTMGAVTQNIFSFGNSGGATDNQARFVTAAGDKALYYSLAQSGSSAQIGPVFGNAVQYLVLFEFVSTSELNAYWNDWTTASYSIDPRNNPDYDNWDSIIIGARTAGSENDALADLKIGAWFHTTDTLTATEKSDIFSYWNTRFSLGL